ncbi:anaerobic ribonucleoside-triphosphate reductase [Methanosarcinales archaeon ex4572_44]|nr:MAG: anaerobic ribonucleoside-triphosphate reductase [Methanosarcinales archaeon ex4572_44]
MTVEQNLGVKEKRNEDAQSCLTSSYLCEQELLTDLQSREHETNYHPPDLRNPTVQKTLEGTHLSMPKVRTTDGHFVEWNRNLIIKQLLKETRLSEQFYKLPSISDEVAKEIARETERRIQKMNVEFLSGPLIRELVNIVLLEHGHTEWRNISTRVGTPVSDAYQIDMGSGFEARDNANLQENAETSHKKKADKISKEQYLLLLPPNIADAHLKGDIHIHDLEYLGTRAFCQDWDLRYFFYYGLMPDGSGTRASVAGPAMKPEVAVLHAVKALGSAQTNFAGGQGFYNFLTFLAPYIEGLSYEEIEQLMQMFVYEMTQMMVARGGQLVFSSVQLSPGVPKLWHDKPAVYKGKVWDGASAPLRTYKEFEREVRLAFEALLRVMLKGDHWGKPFNFPKPEISIEPDFMKEDMEFNRNNPDVLSYDELYTLAFTLAAKHGAPYFDNQLPEYRGAGEGISCYQCCAYNFSTSSEEDNEFDEKLNFKDGKHFSMGAWQVVSINCPRAAYRAGGNNEKLKAELKKMMDTAVELFKVKREWMNHIIQNKRMPFATQQPKDPQTDKKGTIAVDLENLVYTIGVIGINEMVQHHTGHQLHEDRDALRLAIQTMYELKFYAKELSEKHNMEIALARTPAETTCQRFAVSDLLHNEYRHCAEPIIKGDLKTTKEKIQETRDLPIYYTNGTHIPPSAETNLIERIQIEHTFFPIVDGGNILHIWLGEAQPDPHGLKDFAMRLAKNTQVGYFAFTRDITICLNDYHITPGLKDRCPNCGSENVEQMSRVTGYMQAVSGWNEAKKQELKDRKRYNANEMI